MTTPAVWSKGFINANMSYVVLGEPSHVYDLPCAEWHEWSE